MLVDILEITLYLFLIVGVMWAYVWVLGKIIDWFSDLNH